MVENPAKEQLRRMRATAACRFIAAERLQGRDRRSAVLIAVASSIVLFLTVVPLMYHVSPLVASGLTALSFITSILIIAFSLIQYSNNDAASAEQMHRSGLEINEGCRRFEAGIETAGVEETRHVAELYNSILQKYSINHDKVDFDASRLSRPEAYRIAFVERAWIRLRAAILAAAPYGLLALVLIAFVLVVASDVLVARFSGVMAPL